MFGTREDRLRMRSARHLNALRAFEATARLGSYAAAGREIGVTPEAVGQLVRGLEAVIGTPLFVRATTGSRRLIPTAAAADVLPEVTGAFRSLATVTEALRRADGAEQLTVTAPPSFTARWLVPRLDRFRTRWPDVAVRLDVTEQLVDLAGGDADLAVRYGRGGWKGLIAKPLFPTERLFPVCSPSLLERHPSLMTCADVAGLTLIADATVGDRDFPGWKEWFALIGSARPTDERTVEFNASLPVIEAALSGQGVALVRERLVGEDLAAGRLVRLMPDRALDTGWTYYVVTAVDPQGQNVDSFRTWIEREAAQDLRQGPEGLQP